VDREVTLEANTATSGLASPVLRLRGFPERDYPPWRRVGDVVRCARKTLALSCVLGSPEPSDILPTVSASR